MAKAADESPVCEACGADVRAESLFCYNCGKSVKIAQPEPTATAVHETAPLRQPVNIEEPTGRPPLESAASLRKKRRAMNRQPIEVSWEVPERTPIGFYIVTAFLTVGALVLLVLALYLR